MTAHEDSYQKIQDDLHLAHALPVDQDWSAAADFLQLLIKECLSHKPQNILECSCGVSTLILARCCQINQHGKVYSLENDPKYADICRQHLSDFKLEEYAEIIDAPLEKLSIEGNEYQWYSLDIEELPSVDLLVIDGPPGFLQRHSRFPALPLLHHKLNKTCKVLLDDAARNDELDIVANWLQQFSEFKHEFINNQRGCSLLFR